MFFNALSHVSPGTRIRLATFFIYDFLRVVRCFFNGFETFLGKNDSSTPDAVSACETLRRPPRLFFVFLFLVLDLLLDLFVILYIYEEKKVSIVS